MALREIHQGHDRRGLVVGVGEGRIFRPHAGNLPGIDGARRRGFRRFHDVGFPDFHRLGIIVAGAVRGAVLDALPFHKVVSAASRADVPVADVGRPDHGANMQHLLAGIVDPIGLDPHQVFPFHQSGAVVAVELLDRVSAGRLHLRGLDPKNHRLAGFQDKTVQFSADGFGFAAVFLVLMDNAVMAQIEILFIVVEELNIFIGIFAFAQAVHIRRIRDGLRNQQAGEVLVIQAVVHVAEGNAAALGAAVRIFRRHIEFQGGVPCGAAGNHGAVAVPGIPCHRRRLPDEFLAGAVPQQHLLRVRPFHLSGNLDIVVGRIFRFIIHIYARVGIGCTSRQGVCPHGGRHTQGQQRPDYSPFLHEIDISFSNILYPYDRIL